MDEFKSEKGRLPSLRSAMRRARAESAEQHEALADLRQGEVARLELLEDSIRPILDQTPDDVELFDLGVTHGDRPPRGERLGHGGRKIEQGGGGH